MGPTLKWLWKGLLVTAFAALPAAPALAGNCASGATCIFELTNVNIFNTVPGDINIDIRVTVNNTGANTILTFAFISDNLTNSPLGIDQIFYNSGTAATVLPAGWAQASNNCLGGGPPPCNADGFGDFLGEIDNSASTDLSVTFTLAALITAFADNETGGEFAAHIRYGGNCSGFVSDGTAPTPTQNGNCTPIRHEGPEPGSLLLLGIGIAALGLARRKMSTRT